MSIEKNDTAEKIYEIIAEKLTIEKEIIKPNATLQDLGADSLDMVEIVMKIEEEYGIEINDDVVEKLRNVQDFIDYVHQLRIKNQ